MLLPELSRCHCFQEKRHQLQHLARALPAHARANKTHLTKEHNMQLSFYVFILCDWLLLAEQEHK